MSNERQPPAGSLKRWWFQFSTRSLLIALTILAILFGGVAWFQRRYIEPRQHSVAIQEELRALRTRRPANLAPLQWESAVAWTSNLHGNSLLIYQTDLPTVRRFHKQLSQKLDGEVDLQTIYWIWDEYAKVCPGGKSYQRFRELMQEEIDAGGANWSLNVP